jgi:hypothetical protein
MISGMFGQAPIPDELSRQVTVARVGADGQSGKRCHSALRRSFSISGEVKATPRGARKTVTPVNVAHAVG